MQDLFKETIQSNYESMKMSRENMRDNNKINKRLVVIILALIGFMILQSISHDIRDTNIAKQYFNQSLTQKSTKDGLLQEFGGGGD